jgi:hypothetical protein
MRLNFFCEKDHFSKLSASDFWRPFFTPFCFLTPFCYQVDLTERVSAGVGQVQRHPFHFALEPV